MNKRTNEHPTNMLHIDTTARLLTNACHRTSPSWQTAALRACYYSTASSSQGAAGSHAESARGTPPPLPEYESYPYRYGHGGWGYWHPGPHRHKRGRFFMFLFAFAGGMFAYKLFSGGCADDRWERRHARMHGDDGYYAQDSYQENGSAVAAAKVDLQKLPIVASLRSNPEFEEVHLLNNQVVVPTTNSSFEDSLMLPSKPVEFSNGLTGEKVAVVTLPKTTRRHSGWYGFGRRNGHRRGGQSDRLVMLMDEYMKLNAAQLLDVPQSAVYTAALNVDFRSQMNPHDRNIIIKTTADKDAAKEGGPLTIVGSIMTTDGQLISKLHGSFTANSNKAPPAGKNVYHFRKWMWSD